MSRPARCTAALAALLTTAAVGTETASACSCIQITPKSRVDNGEPALTARVIRRRVTDRDPSGWPTEYAYKLRVGRRANAGFRRHMGVTGQAGGNSCGFKWRVGQRIGAFMYRADGAWTTSSCGIVSPKKLAPLLQPLSAKGGTTTSKPRCGP
jgi:hypothetical protein